MLPELIMKEERERNHLLLAVLGFVSAIIGFKTASIIFPAKSDFLGVFLAAIPLVYPLTKEFLKDEKEGRPHLEEVKIYGALFAGEVAGFFLLGLTSPEAMSIQISMFESQLVGMGITGYAFLNSSFMVILLNNLMVFGFILLVSTLIGSAGAFILTWNASVLGVFLGILTREVSHSARTLLAGSGTVPSPLAYIPHATFEMTGFIVAGISGSLISAAVYREHFDRNTWKDFLKFIGTGIALIFIGAFIETA